MQLISGQKLSQKILDSLKQRVEKLPFQPVFCDVLVGNDPASVSYVNTKARRAEEIGLKFEMVQCPESAATANVISEINRVQQNLNLAGLIVQLPLPPQLDKSAILNSIDPKFDVDYLSEKNTNLFYAGQGKLVPPTAAAVMTILDELSIDLAQKKILVVGQGDLVGKPVTFLLKQKGYQVLTADQSTQDLKSLTQEADIIISGTGRPKLITADLIKPDAILIDCGTAESAGSIVGDVDLESVKDKANFVSPVPGGVGPVTVAQLLYNVVTVAESLEIKK